MDDPTMTFALAMDRLDRAERSANRWREKWRQTTAENLRLRQSLLKAEDALAQLRAELAAVRAGRKR